MSKKRIVISTGAKRSGEISKDAIGEREKKTKILRQAQDDLIIMHNRFFVL